MSFLHVHSCESMKSELDLFSLPSTETNYERGDWISYQSIASLNDAAPIEFVVPGRGTEYLDLAQTLLNIKVKITDRNGAALEPGTNVGPINNYLHSLFSHCDVFLNDKLISSPTHTYPFRAYIEGLINYGSDAQRSHQTTRLFYKDKASFMDEFAGNTGFIKRQAFIDNSRVVDLIGNIHADLFNQDRLMLNGVDLRVKLIRSKDVFHLMSEVPGVKSTIIEATLLIRKVQINPSILVAHNRILEKSNAKYPITRVDIKTITIATGIQSRTMDNLYLGQTPKRVIIGFVSNAATNGSFTRNPFNFGHFGHNYLSLYIDGQQKPSKPLQPDFENNLYAESYYSLFSGTGIHYSNRGISVDREEYPNGYCLTAFDTTPDLSASEDFWSLQRNSTMRIEVRFATALTEAVDCLIYAEFDNLLEVTRDRNVIVDYNN
jgi:hypothetical protein